jgi:hypothetical protein
VDPRQKREKVDEDAARTEFDRQEKVVLELESSLRDIGELHEQLKALLLSGELFKADRLQGELDLKVNELRARLGQVLGMKVVTNPTLQARVLAVQERIDEFLGRRVPRESTVTRSVAEKTLLELKAFFEQREFAQVGSLGAAWGEYLRGKQVDADARPVLDEVNALRGRARILADADGIVITITGTIVDEQDPARSMAMVNGVRLHVGDPLDDKKEVHVYRVLRGGVEFVYQGEVFFRERHTGAAKPAKPGPGASRPSLTATPSR